MTAGVQSLVLLAEICAGLLFARLLIPVFRRLKTGKFEIYIGDRFKKDGSEPRFGGVIMLLTFTVGMFLAMASAKPSSQELMGAVTVLFYCTALTAMGLAEDMERDTVSGIGIKPLYRFAAKLVLSGGLTAAARMFGFDGQMLLLPFRQGYIDLGPAYIPLSALLMTAMMTAAEVHDCHRGIHETGTDGLCCMSSMISLAALSAGFSASSGRELAQMICLCGSASAAVLLVWSISPSKIYPGQSGGLFLGGIMCGALVISGLHAAVLLAMAAPIADAACAVIQRAVFKKRKKLIFKGASLHEHFKALGWNDYKVMCIFALIQALGCAGAAAFIVYENKLVI